MEPGPLMPTVVLVIGGLEPRRQGRKAAVMNGFTELRLQVAKDRIDRMHADAARERFARRTPQVVIRAGRRPSLATVFGRSLRALVAGR